MRRRVQRQITIHRRPADQEKLWLTSRSIKNLIMGPFSSFGFTISVSVVKNLGSETKLNSRPPASLPLSVTLPFGNEQDLDPFDHYGT